jgi:hypothetical protein
MTTSIEKLAEEWAHKACSVYWIKNSDNENGIKDFIESAFLAGYNGNSREVEKLTEIENERLAEIKFDMAYGNIEGGDVKALLKIIDRLTTSERAE